MRQCPPIESVSQSIDRWKRQPLAASRMRIGIVQRAVALKMHRSMSPAEDPRSAWNDRNTTADKLMIIT